MPKPKIIINNGDRFTKLVVINSHPSEEEKPESLKNRRAVECLCDCENKLFTIPFKLKSQHTISCGCAQRERLAEVSTTHGMSGERWFGIWYKMVSRCTNPADPSYQYYGGRGIEVCDRWRESCKNFWEDMAHSHQKDLSLDRIDNDKGYCADNCRWTDGGTQAHNKRHRKGKSGYQGVYYFDNTNKFSAAITSNGKRKHLFYCEDERACAKAYDDASEVLFLDRPNKTEHCKDSIFETVMSKLIGNNMVNLPISELA